MIDETIRIAIAGNVDSGKSTFAGVLVNNRLDDGRGLCRNLILRNKHELESGRTSNISFNNLSKIMDEKRKILSLIDLAGHEKYLKTTMSGITGLFVDYGLILVSANMGITKMTKEHLALLLYQKIPIIILITKIDMAPKQVKQMTINKIKKIVNLPIFKKKAYAFPEDDNNCKEELNLFLNLESPLDTFIPIFNISNKTGQNIENIKNFLFSLKTRDHWQKEIDGSIMYIDSKFNVRGIGLVVSGTLRGKPIKLNDKLFIGPINDKFISFKVRSMHNNIQENINELKNNEVGCIALRFLNKEIVTKEQIKRGVVIFDKENFTKNICWRFKAEIIILNHSTTISDNYQPVIHCGNVRQTANLKIIESTSKSNKLRTKDKAVVEFKFTLRKEFVEVGSVIFFRDGNTKGYGTVIEIYD
tara:strand:- start:1971 stop:3221 length:1251 start_codon:yes stop_codon:yes gene_type:complete